MNEMEEESETRNKTLVLLVDSTNNFDLLLGAIRSVLDAEAGAIANLKRGQGETALSIVYDPQRQPTLLGLMMALAANAPSAHHEVRLSGGPA